MDREMSRTRPPPAHIGKVGTAEAHKVEAHKAEARKREPGTAVMRSVAGVAASVMRSVAGVAASVLVAGVVVGVAAVASAA